MRPHLILASSSPYRRELLTRLGFPFDVVAPEIDEAPHPDETAAALVARLATAKARTVAARYADALVIGSDQVAEHDGGIVGKPHDHPAAVRQLRAASGRRIVLHTGVALVNAATGRAQCHVVPYAVTFRTLTDDQIEAYLRKEQPYGCTGSVRAEGLGAALLERHEGDDPSALIGLPLIRLIQMLEREGVHVI